MSDTKNLTYVSVGGICVKSIFHFQICISNCSYTYTYRGIDWKTIESDWTSDWKAMNSNNLRVYVAIPSLTSIDRKTVEIEKQ